MDGVDGLDAGRLLDHRPVLDVDGDVTLQVDGLLLVQHFVGSETRQASKLTSCLPPML